MMLKSQIFFSLIFFLITHFSFSQGSNELALAKNYFQEEAFDKALSIYQKLAKDEDNWTEIYSEYTISLRKTNQLDEASKFLKKLCKKYPTHSLYNIDYGIILGQLGKPDQAKKHYDQYIEKIADNKVNIKYAGKAFKSAGRLDYAEKLYLKGNMLEKGAFDFELADLYGIQGKTELMIETYLKRLDHRPKTLIYVQNMLQYRLDEKSYPILEEKLFKRIQEHPQRIVYNECLVWYYLQHKSFVSALIQAKALDRRKYSTGYVSNISALKVYEVAELSTIHDDFSTAVKAYQYIIEKYSGNRDVTALARKKMINVKEKQLKSTFPIDSLKIKDLAKEYQLLIDQYGYTMKLGQEAAIDLALLQAFYLDDKKAAISSLETMIKAPRVNSYVKAQAKIHLGDIYLLMGDYAEATLYYYQAEKSQKDRPLGHQAKLKNAQLAYYEGDFELAKSHLDVLKLATTRKISNDAIDLSLLIMENVALDTTDEAMRAFSSIELLIFQSKYPKAIKAFDDFREEYKGHTLIDDAIMKQGELYLKIRSYQQSVNNFQLIVDKFGRDVNGDDANFLLGDIHEKFLNMPKKAMEYYMQQAKKYPSSIHVVEALKRYRKLRGDKLYQD